MKNKNCYDKFVESLLSLPGDIRGDIMRIGQRNTTNGNAYHYLFKRVQKQDLDDPIYTLMVGNGILTSEMILK
jgi:hypothetical protein